MIDVRNFLSLRREVARCAAAAFAVLMMSGAAQSAVVINYSGGFPDCNTAELTCVGNPITPSTSSGVLILTPGMGDQSGAAFSTTAIELGPNATFSTTFQFQFLPGVDSVDGPYGWDPADGITFILARDSSGLGGGGGGLGYDGILNSVAIEFDTWNNGGADNDSSNHVAVNTGGTLEAPIAYANPYGVTTCLANGQPGEINTRNGCMSNGHVWSVTIGYDGGTHALTVQVQDGALAPQLLFTANVDIVAALGYDPVNDPEPFQAFVGFTGGTGAGWEEHRILNWQFATDTTLSPEPPSGVPLPATSGLMALGLAALGIATTRRRISM